MFDLSSEVTLSRHRLRRGLALAAVLGLCVGAGCSSRRPTAEWVYFPPAPAQPRVVHLASFNALYELVSPPSTWRTAFRGRGVSPYVARPACVAYHRGHLYIGDAGLGVVHDWDLASGRARRIGQRGEVRLSKPVGVAVGDDYTVYVADTGRGEVVAFDVTSGRPRRMRPAGADSYRPVAAAVAGARLYVACADEHRVDVFSLPSGEHLSHFGESGRSPGQFSYPMGITADAKKNLLVADMMNGRVQVFTDRFVMQRTIGQAGNRYGSFGKPRGVAVGPDGVLFVADAEFAHVHLFDESGRLLMLFGGAVDGPGGTPLPVGVAIAESLPDTLASRVPEGFRAAYFLFVVNSVGAKRISLFAIGAGAS